MRIDNEFKFLAGSDIPLMLQSEASECGLACLAMVASFHGQATSLADLRKQFPISLKGVAIDQLIEMADQLGLSSRPLRLELGELQHLQTPCLLHWDLRHFVVLKSIQKDIVTVLDPACGVMKYTVSSVSDHFTGVALELTPKLDFKRKAAAPPMRLVELVGKVVGLKRGLLQLLSLAAALEAFALLSPLLSQWITDDAIVTGEQELLGLLCLSVILLGVAQAGISVLRSWIGLYISTSFNLQWMSNVMAHMLRLPIDFFERRHLGDIVNRFGSVRAIEQMMTTAMVDVILDGCLSVGTLVMMLLYSPTLAAVTIAAVSIYCLLRWARFNAVRLANQGLIVKQALEQTFFLETIRGVRSIKLFNRENARRSSWIDRMVGTTNAELHLQKINLTFTAAWSVLAAAERGGVFWLGALAVIDGKMTLGMLFAFLSYKEQFSGRVNALVDRFIDFKMLSVQTERLSDIVLAAPEENVTRPFFDTPSDLTLAVENLTFRYGPGEKNVLANVSITVNPGECVAIVGGSGGGKTTLMKLMMSILRPSLGDVKLGGIPIAKIGLRQYRSLIGTVMQDDQLYAGSMSDNISFFDAKPDQAWIEDCARHAGIHDEISAMPMGYHTLVGDMGTVLSGGQKQRVLIARALHKRPKILFFDEATSHLDPENEKILNNSIAALDITRIIVAHRPNSVAIADRIIRIEGGRALEIKRPPTAAAPNRAP